MSNIYFLKTLVKAVFFLSIVACKSEIGDKKQPILDADLTNNSLAHLNDKNGNYFTLEDLIAQHKGRVVYVDIWASWCTPCKQMMPASAALKKYFKGKNVAFLYVSIDDDSAAWNAAAATFKLENEESFLASNYPKASFFQNNNVSNIPRYFLYDKFGQIIDDNAMRPIEQDLINTIDALLAL